MAPGWTSYHNRLQYQIYDVTEQLAAENEIAITVGNGWYKGILGFYCQPNQYGTQAGAFAELHVEYEDGSKDVIATDETWSVKTGEIVTVRFTWVRQSTQMHRKSQREMLLLKDLTKQINSTGE